MIFFLGATLLQGDTGKKKEYLKALFLFHLCFTSCNYTVNRILAAQSWQIEHTKVPGACTNYRFACIYQTGDIFLDSALSAQESVLPSHVYPQKIKANTRFTITLVSITDAHTSDFNPETSSSDSSQKCKVSAPLSKLEGRLLVKH